MSNVPDVEESVKKLREALRDLTDPDELSQIDNQETLVRFLKSRNWDVEASEKMLRKSLAWRTDFQPELVECNVCHERPGTHTLRQIGFDEAGRPIIHASFYPANPPQRSMVHGTMEHLVYVMENAVRSMIPPVSQWVFILDCAGMTASCCNPRLAYDCAQIMSNNYPERLGLAIALKPGSVFKMVWQAIKPFLAPTTTAKVCIVNNKDQLEAVCDKYFSADTTKWLMNEYKLNRKKPVRSRYREFWTPPPTTTTKADHDPRGDKAYVKDWIRPDHPTGHLAHPNMLEYIAGTINTIVPSVELNSNSEILEDDDSKEFDDSEVEKLMASIPKEYEIPEDAEKLP
ncbi:unnamed protein product [Calicophoron daubneyi]|uniref:CRAL-TRIO domain-containing protein n=1 Tax=Calicophoron daubneyi TaxID=300641 RepID=A0AAV2TWX1_CALDB